MSQGVHVLGGKCPGGKCLGGKCPEGICPWGKCPGGTCPGGLCPRTAWLNRCAILPRYFSMVHIIMSYTLHPFLSAAVRHHRV